MEKVTFSKLYNMLVVWASGGIAFVYKEECSRGGGIIWNS